MSAASARPKLQSFENEYPSCLMLFRSLLTSGDGGLGPLVARANHISTGTELAEISQILRDLSKVIRGLPTPKAREGLGMLRLTRIFPIVDSGRGDTFDYLARSSDGHVYIADRSHLAHSFRSRLPLLALSSEEIPEMKHLLSMLNVKWPYLSEIVVCEEKPQGRISLHNTYTQFLRDRSPFIES